PISGAGGREMRKSRALTRVSAAKAGVTNAFTRTSFHAQAPTRLSTKRSAAVSAFGDSQSSAAPVDVGAQAPLAIQRAPSSTAAAKAPASARRPITRARNRITPQSDGRR